MSTPTPDPGGPAIGELVAGRFRILDRLGEGGMGVVFKARQEPIDRLVALKFLAKTRTVTDITLERFLREAQAISKLKSRRTVTLFDYGRTDEGDLYIAMEYLGGGTLLSRMAQEPMAWRRAVHIADQICESLAEAHAKGIIHRDLKPDNILFESPTEFPGDPDALRVVDFGIAKLRNATDGPTRPGQILGTPAYMAPEQMRNDDVDGRADLYAVGCLLYEMLAGRQPFHAKDMFTLMYRHVHQEVPTFGQLGVQVDAPPPLGALVMSLLGKLAEDRPRNAESVRSALAAIADGREVPIAIPPPRPPPPPTVLRPTAVPAPRPRARRLRWWALGTFGLVAAGGLWLASDFGSSDSVAVPASFAQARCGAAWSDLRQALDAESATASTCAALRSLAERQIGGRCEPHAFSPDALAGYIAACDSLVASAALVPWVPESAQPDATAFRPDAGLPVTDAAKPPPDAAKPPPDAAKPPPKATPPKSPRRSSVRRAERSAMQPLAAASPPPEVARRIAVATPKSCGRAFARIREAYESSGGTSLGRDAPDCVAVRDLRARSFAGGCGPTPLSSTERRNLERYVRKCLR